MGTDNLMQVGHDQEWLREELAKYGVRDLQEVYLATQPKMQQMLRGMEQACRNNYSTLSTKMTSMGIV